MGKMRWSAAMVAAMLMVGGCSSSEPSPSPSPFTTRPEERRVVAPKVTSFPTAMGTVHLECQGTGAVPVVLVAGTDDPIERWDGLVDDLGQEVLACRFDADEAAMSGPLTGQVTPGVRADSLAGALHGSGLPGPVVLVGHSLGGLTVRQFGAAHGEMLAGALLLDPTTSVALASLHALLSRQGWNAGAAQAETDAPASWPDVPLTVLSHDPTEVPFGDPIVEALWTKGQRVYGQLAAGAEVEVVPGAGHYVDRDAPERVIRAIDDLIRRA